MAKNSQVYIEAYGCSASFSDFELTAGQLQNLGYEIVEDPKNSDINIIITCSVKTATSNKMTHRINQLTRNEKPLIVGGCLPKTELSTIEKINPNASIMGPNSIDSVGNIVKQTLSGKKVVVLDDSKRPKINLPKLRINPIVDIVEIGSGCLSACTFCQVKIAKGTIRSYPPDDIKNQIISSVNEGCKEIWLTSTDNACYGLDMFMDLADLINTVSSIDDKFITRIGMMNPMHVKNNFSKLVNSFDDEKIFKFLHIPVQTGSDKILKSMKRGHTTAEFISMVEKFRKSFPLSAISTDIIVGYPEETDDDFIKTKHLIESLNLDVVNLSKYGARPGTEAIKLPQLDNSVIKERSQILSKIIKEHSLKCNSKWLDWEGDCIVDEIGKKPNTMIGRNFAYKPVVVQGGDDLLGKEIKVQITDYSSNYLLGSKIS